MRASRGMGDINPNKIPCFAKGDWIKGAIEKPGALRKSLGVKKGVNIPSNKLSYAAAQSGKMGKRARLAQTLKGMK